jgi:hypothetical protein
MPVDPNAPRDPMLCELFGVYGESETHAEEAELLKDTGEAIMAGKG